MQGMGLFLSFAFNDGVGFCRSGEGITRAILGVLGTLLFASTVQSATMWNDHIGKWLVGAYSDDRVGGFSHCAASASYQNGVLLLFSVAKNFTWSIAFANPKWQIKPGTQYDVSYWVDNEPAQFATPTAISDELVSAVLPDNVALFNSFRRGQTLYVKVRGTDLAPVPFMLTNISQMLATDINAIGPIVIGRDASECKKAFASGAMPVETDGKVASLFTRCGLGKDAYVSFYLVAPRKAGGVYVIGTYADEQEESVKNVDSGVKTAVFHALPK
jgi:hypothetical protein